MDEGIPIKFIVEAYKLPSVTVTAGGKKQILPTKLLMK